MVSSEGIDSLVLPYYPTFAVFACRCWVMGLCDVYNCRSRSRLQEFVPLRGAVGGQETSCDSRTVQPEVPLCGFQAEAVTSGVAVCSIEFDTEETAAFELRCE